MKKYLALLFVVFTLVGCDKHEDLVTKEELIFSHYETYKENDNYRGYIFTDKEGNEITITGHKMYETKFVEGYEYDITYELKDFLRPDNEISTFN
jgi:hypothetical protein